jgi:nucleoside-diphosphate-sugar epimerase
VRALVTGANGTIGSCLVATLIERGHQARALLRPTSDRSSLEGLEAEVVEGDVCDLEGLKRAAEGCDWIFHLGAARPAKTDDRRLFTEVNVGGTKNVAEAALSAGVQRLVFTSSIGVYGFVTRGPIDETFTVRPNTHYRSSKADAEKVLLNRHKSDGLPVVIARLSSIVGRGAKSWLPFYRAARQRNFRIVGPGANRIQIGYATDAAECLLRCAETPGVEGEVFNVSGAGPLTVRQYVDIVRGEVGADGDFGRLPAAPFLVYTHLATLAYRATRYEPPRTRHYEVFLADMAFDLSKARERLGFVPDVTTAECVSRTAQYFRNERLL